MACNNPHISKPQPPGEWVDDESCVCGALYDEFRAFPPSKKKGQRFSRAANHVRTAAGGFESGGGYRSRRVVLWMMRVIKLAEWYESHVGCEGLVEE
jgi:hypothetical protein